MRVLLLVLPLVLAACDSDPFNGPPLSGTAWVLQSFEGQTAQPSSISFADGRFSGVAACNQYDGTYGALYTDIAGLVFSADVESMTEAPCRDGLDTYEDAYWDALEAATRWALEEVDDRLVLTGPGVRLVFEPSEAGGAP